MTVDERLAAPLLAKPEMASLNCGSLNFGIFPMLQKYKDWQHDWEPAFLDMTRDLVFKNTFQDIEYTLRELGETHGTRFEFECYDLGHLYNLAYFVEKGLIKPPFFIQMIYGIRRDLQARFAGQGHRVRVYVPFGGAWYPYLMRRLGERPANLYFVLRNLCRS